MDRESGLRRGKGQAKQMTEAPMRRFQQLLSEGKTSIEMIEENATTRRETKSSRALKGHALRDPEDMSGSLNKGNEDWKEAFSLRKFCNGWLVRGTTSFCKVNCNFACWKE